MSSGCSYILSTKAIFKMMEIVFCSLVLAFTKKFYGVELLAILFSAGITGISVSALLFVISLSFGERWEPSLRFQWVPLFLLSPLCFIPGAYTVIRYDWSARLVAAGSYSVAAGIFYLCDSIQSFQAFFYFQQSNTDDE
ncbi:unnamed protein product [Acanthoscelides obtectus]|uniref:Uncharacterized protein n=1 Tax=Acanthoscelides obtectus TaxID=200917 RepID=A0A9P0LC48_ACAOB|nr:unnamed protein product [Acanthoscelides obtectus]CAK1662250.1 hypothetical protein AOBTE_LOCUS23055 [Acanthoscelides obtectus]